MSAGKRGIDLLIWVCVFTVVCIVFISLRFWAAAIARRRIFPDDAMIVFALVSTCFLLFLLIRLKVIECEYVSNWYAMLMSILCVQQSGQHHRLGRSCYLGHLQWARKAYERA
jgi:hypothetical protein